ncbi:MAG: hypothetical protein WCJ64_12920 [Rhodospirillaceae bacterium]
MTPPWVQRLFAECPTLFYRMTMLERVCIEQWTSYRGEEEGGLHRLIFLAEIDPVALGGGGAKICLRGELVCTAALEPVVYRLEGNSISLHLRFETDWVEVLLRDGSKQRVERAGAAFLSDGNFPATMALVYAALGGGTAAAESLSLKLFLVNTLVTVPYETFPADKLAAPPSRWHRTSHRSEVLLDDSGVMLVARLPDSGLTVTLEREALPLPNWPDGLLSDTPPLVYRPPPGADFRLEDVEIEGPVTPIGATSAASSASSSGQQAGLCGSSTAVRRSVS